MPDENQTGTDEAPEAEELHEDLEAPAEIAEEVKGGAMTWKTPTKDRNAKI
jgi:hypothetical protein